MVFSGLTINCIRIKSWLSYFRPITKTHSWMKNVFLNYLKSLMLIFLMSTGIAAGQNQTQTVKGFIKDSKAGYPLIGASVILIGSDPVQGAVTDVNGKFVIENVPAGRQSFAVQYIGYKTISLPNVLVTTGKEVVLNIDLEESVEALNEVVVTADSEKDLPINELAKVSARTFSLEEVTRFSGGRNDVAKLATSFAGVSATNDSRNDIVVRGNSPTALLWRIDGIPISNPNHFSTLGTTGGPVSALNTNLLRNSDFLTGAFPAEYGNANAAVFDINFRNGNTDKYEFTAQLAAFSGLEFLAEGPISKNKGSSFIASYRYGIASVAAPGTSAAPFYQDFSFKANFGETKLGRFELFGLGGLSSIDFFGDEIDENDLFANPDENAFVESQIGLVGLSNLIRMGKKTYLKTTLGLSTNFNDFRQDNLIRNEAGETVRDFRAVNVNNREVRYTLSSVLNHKFNARWSIRSGLLSEIYNVDFFTEDRDNRVEIPDEDDDNVPDFFILVTDMEDSYTLHQFYSQAEYKFSDDLSATFGLHSQYMNLSENLSLEPRAAISWQFQSDKRLSLAYGNHSQVVPTPVLFYIERDANGTVNDSNRALDFMRSNHYVLGYDQNLGSEWRLKGELYYQQLYNIPVERSASSYSVINEGGDFVFDQRTDLESDGTGRNYGVELTIEKFFSKGYYMLVTTSVYDSRYKGSDGVSRNTSFNNNYVFNLLGGKEWKFGPGGKNAWTFDTKLTTSGGQPFTPVDLEATRNNLGREIRQNDIAFSERYGEYFRWDMKFGVRLNSSGRNVSHQFFVDFQNITNRENEFVRRYNEVTDEINTVNQIGFFPDILYRIQF